MDQFKTARMIVGGILTIAFIVANLFAFPYVRYKPVSKFALLHV